MRAASATPAICFGTVHHLRLRPARHAFRYGVFFLRLPLRTLGESGFASRLLTRNRRGLVSFHDADHGDGRQPLLTWIDALLAQEGIHDADGEIWLQTFPRVFGYVFNPVSFWYCHRADGHLRAVLCEVNNTFGERHCYLLDDGKPIAADTELRARKVFHVSPFCRVEGGYRFRFLHRIHDTAAGRIERVSALVDYDDTLGPLLRTSITGTVHALSDLRLIHALLRHPLLTFGVTLRIHWQALQLWCKRVPFFRRPSPSTNELHQ